MLGVSCEYACPESDGIIEKSSQRTFLVCSAPAPALGEWQCVAGCSPRLGRRASFELRFKSERVVRLSARVKGGQVKTFAPIDTHPWLIKRGAVSSPPTQSTSSHLHCPHPSPHIPPFTLPPVMIASKMMTASILFLATALSASATNAGEFPRCNLSRRGPGKDTPMQVIGTGTNYDFSTAGFRVKKVKPNTFDITSGPTRAGYAVVRLLFTGVQDDRTFRYDVNSWQTCTTIIQEGPLGSGVGATIETY
jgi:hypothetical protein